MSIDKTASQYHKVSLWILCALTLLGLFLMQLTSRLMLLEPILVSVGFQLVCTVFYGLGWKAVARRSPETLTKFYLAGSALRLMAAAIVLLIVCVIRRADIEVIKWFAAVFIVYYVVMLLFDAIFFAKVSKNSNK